MRRELKFRAWDEPNEYHGYPEGCMTYNAQPDCDADVIMQFTGLLDRNGKEVYEGDVCNVKERSLSVYCVAEVIWGCEYGWSFRAYYNGKGKGDYFGIRFTGVSEVEVIGNIYEHPHLLTEATP